MTTEELYALPVQGDTWRVLPNGNCVKIGNDVKLGDDVKWTHSPLAVQGSRHLAVNVAPGMIQIGCQTRSFTYWEAHGLGFARENGYSNADGLEYDRIVRFLIDNGVGSSHDPA